MKQTVNLRVIILIISVTVLIFGGVALGLVIGSQNEKREASGTPRLTTNVTSYDFGDVSMAQGLAKYTIQLKNEGTGNLKVSNISTSCMCTTAVLEINGERSPVFGMPGHGAGPAFWSTQIAPGQSANLEVTFDPNAHGPNATGPVTRVINLITNDGGKDGVRKTLTVTANVVK